MNSISKSRGWVAPACFLIAFSAIFSLSGCNSTATVTTSLINEDSVKAHILPIGVATQYTAAFRASIDSFNKRCPGFKDSMNFGHAESFNSDAISMLLKQKNAKGELAAGIRIYYGRDNTGMIRMILVPYDPSNNDIINVMVDMANKAPNSTAPHAEALQTGSGGQTIEVGQHCPTICDGGGSGLNGGGN